MAITFATPSTSASEFVYRLSVAQYHQMIELGILQEGEPVELLEGLLCHTRPSDPNDDLYRLTVAQYHAMIDADILTTEDRVELLEGILTQKMSKKSPHRIALARTLPAIHAVIPTGWSVQLQDPITLDRSEPEPDACVFRGIAEDYREGHPNSADVWLVIEVADSSLRRDQGIKRIAYARGGIERYWIVNLISREIEVYTSPNRATGMYDHSEVFAEGTVVLLDLPDGSVVRTPVADLLD